MEDRKSTRDSRIRREKRLDPQSRTAYGGGPAARHYQQIRGATHIPADQEEKAGRGVMAHGIRLQETGAGASPGERTSTTVREKKGVVV